MTQYTIISIDDSRARLRDAIHDAMEQSGVRRSVIRTFVDGRNPDILQAHVDNAGYKITGQNFHNGELGIWFSQLHVLDCIAQSSEPHIVFEDDAVVHVPIFREILPHVMEELPEDWDFFAWAIPADQKVDYYYNRLCHADGGWTILSHIRHKHDESPHYIGKDFVVKAYQGYQAVAIMYSPKGAQKIIDLVRETGIDTPYDCMLFRDSLRGVLNGYTLDPDVYPVVTFEELGTIARNSGMFN